MSVNIMEATQVSPLKGDTSRPGHTHRFREQLSPEKSRRRPTDLTRRHADTPIRRHAAASRLMHDQ
jgi:hypothetical protein